MTLYNGATRQSPALWRQYAAPYIFSPPSVFRSIPSCQSTVVNLTLYVLPILQANIIPPLHHNPRPHSYSGVSEAGGYSTT